MVRPRRATACAVEAARLRGFRYRDACASGRTEGGTNPFLSHGFMRALEDSGSVAPQRGWGTTHLLARDTAGTLLGVAPLYVKGHSYGYAFSAAPPRLLEPTQGRSIG